MSEADRIRELRRKLRNVARARRRAGEREHQLTVDETALMSELSKLGVTQADIGRDCGITRMAVGLRLASKAKRPKRGATR